MLEDFTRYDSWILAVAMIVMLWLWHRQTKIKTRNTRRAMFDDCLGLFSNYATEQDDVNFPNLSGIYRGYKVRLEPIVDQLTFRKLPSLWMSVTIYQSLPVAGILDYLVRPQNTEFYSPWANLPFNLDIPEGWPRHAVLRTDTEQSFPVDVISPFVFLFDEDLTIKEMLISPRGVRFVYQADESQRSHYLVLRQPLFENLRVDVEKLTNMLEKAIALANVLNTQDDSSPQHDEKNTTFDSIADELPLDVAHPLVGEAVQLMAKS